MFSPMLDKTIRRAGADKLARWAKRRKLSKVDAARACGLSPQEWSRFVAGSEIPGMRRAERIQDRTDGAVPVGAWTVAAP